MSYEMTIAEGATVAGRSYPYNATLPADGLVTKEISVPVAKVGALTTRSSDSVGELTMVTGHGITTGARLDLYWTGGSRRGITVGTVSVEQIPMTGGTGDVLPADETAITAMVPLSEATPVAGDDVVAIAVYSDQAGTFVIADASNVELVAYEAGGSTGGAQSNLWTLARNPTNPVAGDAVAKTFFSHGSSVAAATMRIAMMYN